MEGEGEGKIFSASLIPLLLQKCFGMCALGGGGRLRQRTPLDGPLSPPPKAYFWFSDAGGIFNDRLPPKFVLPPSRVEWLWQSREKIANILILCFCRTACLFCLFGESLSYLFRAGEEGGRPLLPLSPGYGSGRGERGRKKGKGGIYAQMRPSRKGEEEEEARRKRNIRRWRRGRTRRGRFFIWERYSKYENGGKGLFLEMAHLREKTYRYLLHVHLRQPHVVGSHHLIAAGTKASSSSSWFRRPPLAD